MRNEALSGWAVRGDDGAALLTSFVSFPPMMALPPSPRSTSYPEASTVNERCTMDGRAGTAPQHVVILDMSLGLTRLVAPRDSHLKKRRFLCIGCRDRS
jgi:hypothetical protein